MIQVVYGHAVYLDEFYALIKKRGILIEWLDEDSLQQMEDQHRFECWLKRETANYINSLLDNSAPPMTISEFWLERASNYASTKTRRAKLDPRPVMALYDPAASSHALSPAADASAPQPSAESCA